MVASARARYCIVYYPNRASMHAKGAVEGGEAAHAVPAVLPPAVAAPLPPARLMPNCNAATFCWSA